MIHRILLSGLAAGLSPLVASAQDASPVPTSGAEGERSQAAGIEDLRGRIHEMRSSLLVGGDSVRRAESEAADFYRRKMDAVDQRLDVVHADLSEARASYDVVLDRALSASGSEQRSNAMGEASTLRSRIRALERERADLEETRKGLLRLVDAVQKRQEERDRLALQIDASGGVDESFSWVMGGVGLAPPLAVEASASPLADDALVADLLARDPRRARAILFEADPVAYWDRFPLRPPADVLADALFFPPPDLPGQR